MNHPEDVELLRYADGEMPARESSEIRMHLESCWQCRTQMEELHQVIADCVRYRKDLLHVYLPSPPARWGDIYQGFAEVDESRNEVPLFVRIREAFRFRFHAVPAWATGGIAVMLVGILVFQFLQAPAVQAAELLRRAAVAAEARPSKPRLIQIRTSRHKITRRANTAVSVSSTDAASEIQTLFRAARYNWDEPLSVRSFQSWRDGLASKRDDVTTVNQQSPDQSAYVVRTSTDFGEVAQTTLTLRVKDLQPLEERLEFRNHEWMEISEIPDTLPPASGPIAEVRRIAPVAALPQAVREPETTIGQELQVLAALRRLGADLGDPIEVTRERSRIVVAGVGVAADRQEQIHKALDAVPNVVVRFSEPASATGPIHHTASATLSAKQASQELQARMEQQMGGRQNFEQFSAQILDMTDTMMSRAYALRRLGDRFSQGQEGGMSAADRQVLQNLNREHAAAIRLQSAQMEKLLAPVLKPLGGPPAATPAPALRSTSWQPATEELFQTARKVETLLAVMLGVAPGAVNSQLPSEVLGNVAQLRAGSEAFEQLAVQEPGGK